MLVHIRARVCTVVKISIDNVATGCDSSSQTWLRNGTSQLVGFEAQLSETRHVGHGFGWLATWWVGKTIFNMPYSER